MNNRDKIFPAAVLSLTVAGFFLPGMTACLSDVKTGQETVSVRDEEREIPLAGGESVFDILGAAGKLKESVTLRSGDAMDEKSAETESAEILGMLARYGLAEQPGQGQWLITPVLVSDIEGREASRVFWDCVWYLGSRETDPYKIELYLDDESGYLMSFTVYPGRGHPGENPEATVESMKAFLDEYYPLSGETGFQYQETLSGNEFIFTVSEGGDSTYGFRFLIMENGQIVFNM